MDYLSDLEREKIRLFLADEVMVEAVRKVFLKGIEQGTLRPGQKADPLQNFLIGLANSMENTASAIIPDAELGQDLRAAVKAIRMLEFGFVELNKLAEKPKKEKGPKANQAY